MSDLILKTLETRELKLNTMQLRGFYGKKMRRGSGGGSSGDGFPQLPGDVTRWHFGGLTNEMMAAMDDPRIEDADGKGRFLSFKNFLWEGMSGVGGYNHNFNSWGYGSLTGTGSTQTHTSSKMNLNIPSTVKNTNIYSNAISVGKEGDIYDFTLKVMGLKDGALLRITKGVSSGEIERIEKDGIYKIYQPFEAGWDQPRIYIFISNSTSSDLNITIEQLPLYPGFILGDGVDDFAVTEKELNFEDTYTVYTAFIPFQNDPAKNMMMAGKDIKDFYMSYSSLNALSYYSGNKSVVINLSNGFNLLCCKRDADNMTIKNLITGDSVTATANEFINNPGLYYLWRVTNGYSYARLAIAGQTICNGHFSTDEEDIKVLDWHKKQYPWLFPDQAWTVTGKTNEDEDRATIANITGNGNDLILSNFGFAEGSGYNEEGEYAGYLVTDGVDDKIVSSAFKMGEDFTVVGEWKMLPVSSYNYAGIVKSNNLYVYNNASIGLTVFIRSGGGVFNKVEGIKSLKAICFDGRVYGEDWTEYKLNTGTADGANTALNLGFNGSNFTKMAFKNLGIYNNQIFSKDDCIKAYNYLQTLKAKI